MPYQLRKLKKSKFHLLWGSGARIEWRKDLENIITRSISKFYIGYVLGSSGNQNPLALQRTVINVRIYDEILRLLWGRAFKSTKVMFDLLTFFLEGWHNFGWLFWKVEVMTFTKTKKWEKIISGNIFFPALKDAYDLPNQAISSIPFVSVKKWRHDVILNILLRWRQK